MKCKFLLAASLGFLGIVGAVAGLGESSAKKSVSASGEKDSYIYYLENANGFSNNKIYSWGGNNQFGGWSGTDIKNVGTQVSVLKYKGNDNWNIYKIPFDSSDTGFLFNFNGDQEKTNNKTFVKGGAYTWADNDDVVDGGAAIDFMAYSEDIRNAAVYM